jgi:hypothetical protein
MVPQNLHMYSTWTAIHIYMHVCWSCNRSHKKYMRERTTAFFSDPAVVPIYKPTVASVEAAAAAEATW